MINKNGKPNPKKVISHHFCGLRYGAKHDSSKKNTTAIFVKIKNRLVKMRNLEAIGAI